MKSLNSEQKVKKAKKLINNGASWEEAAKKVGFSERYLRELVRKSYSRTGDYKNLCKKAKTGEKTANKQQMPNEEISEEVILAETGYILTKGATALLKESITVFIPAFCIRELSKMAYRMPEADRFLNIFYSSNNFKVISLDNEEVFEESMEGRIRSKGIVSVACHLWVNGMKVRVLTNSREIERLVKEQGFGNDVKVIRRFIS